MTLKKTRNDFNPKPDTRILRLEPEARGNGKGAVSIEATRFEPGVWLSTHDDAKATSPGFTNAKHVVQLNPGEMRELADELFALADLVEQEHEV